MARYPAETAELAGLAVSACTLEVWTRLVRKPGRFASASAEKRFGALPVARLALERW